jgi:multisubunit Na+/H+ antiporter MnhB subunit
MKLKKKNIIIKCAADFLLPVAAMFGFYVIMHGNSSPGGGFQGGVLVASTILLFYMAYSGKNAEKTFHEGFLHSTETLAEIVYIAVALVGILVGGNFCLNIILSPYSEWAIETTMIMNDAVGYHVFAGIICLLIVMLGLLNNEEGSEEK